MAYEASGKLIEIFPTETKGASFTVREFVLEIPSGQYTDSVKFQLTQDKTSLLDDFRKGDAVKVTFDIKGKPYTGRDGETKYFSNLNAWRIEPAGSATSAGGNERRNQEFAKPSDSGLSEDDLPF